MDGRVVGGVGDERGLIQAAVEQLRFARWRKPVYEGPGAEPGWLRFSAVSRDGLRWSLEVRPADAEIRIIPVAPGTPPGGGELRPCA